MPKVISGHLTAIFLFLTVLVIAGCKPSVAEPAEGVTGGNTPAPESTVQAALDSVTWVLESYTGRGGVKSVLPNVEPTATFDRAKGTVTGFGGTNQYSGSYEVTGIKLTIKNLTRTMMAGPGPLDIQEDMFLSIMRGAEAYKIGDGKLEIAGESRMLVFEQKPALVTPTAVPATPASQPGPEAALENVTWVLESYTGQGGVQSVLPDVELTARFNRDNGTVAGFGGINQYSGTYEVTGIKLTIKNLASTKMAGPRPLMIQEDEFLSLMRRAESYKIESDKLQIASGTGIVIFRQKSG